jgi:8-oxo-dGTP diphosphatase
MADAALREVREETGCDGVIEEDLGQIVFWFFVGSSGKRRRVKKSVQFFLLRYARGETRDHDGEVDEAAWLAADIAMRRLTFESERQILVKAIERIRARSDGG